MRTEPYEAARIAANAADLDRTRYLAVSPAVRETLYWLLIEEVRRLETEARSAPRTRRSARKTNLETQADTLRSLADELAR